MWVSGGRVVGGGLRVGDIMAIIDTVLALVLALLLAPFLALPALP